MTRQQCEITMGSKDQRPKTRLGKSNPRRVKIITWTIGLLACGSGLYAAYHYSMTTEVEVAVAPVRRGDFVISVRTRGDIKSARSTILKAPPAPGLRIVHLAAQGIPVKKGDVVVEFDGMQQEQNVIQQTLQVQSIQGSIDQMKATQKINDDADAMSKMNVRIRRGERQAGCQQGRRDRRHRRSRSTASRWGCRKAACNR